MCFALHSRKPNDSIHFMHSHPSPKAKPLSFLYTLAGEGFLKENVKSWKYCGAITFITNLYTLSCTVHSNGE